MRVESLLGQQLEGGWVVTKIRASLPEASGACHSLGLVARHPDGREAFMKVLDTTVDREKSDPLLDLKLRIDVFACERQLVEKCLTQGMSRVVRAIGFGELDPEGAANPVYYLLFELADCDLREQADLNRRFDVAFRLRVLHKSAVGLQQLHWAQIAHQDVKPSNVLVFSGEETKLGDLGHAHDRSAPRPGKDRRIAADPTYAPPEQL